MSISKIIVSGLIGTLAMTFFIELVSLIWKKPYHVVQILSGMIAFGKQSLSTDQKYILYVVAVVLHYAIGVLFAFCFKVLLDADILDLNWTNAILFGCAAGFVGITGWRIFFKIHPSPPDMNLYQYLGLIWCGHLVFSIGLFCCLVGLRS